jgi:hypothetical protein
MSQGKHHGLQFFSIGTIRVVQVGTEKISEFIFLPIFVKILNPVGRHTPQKQEFLLPMEA